MTSNVGTRKVKDFGTGVGFSTKTKEKQSTDEIKSILEKELKNKFAPEFINRIDDIIYFKDLDKGDILKIVDLELVKTISRAKQIGYEINITDSSKEHLIEVGYDPKFGARPLKRAIQRWIDDEITDFIITNSPSEGDKFLVDYSTEDDKTVISLEGKVKKTRKKKED
jgi:ATP-dependent Clp protease ATP-binding subunit ClpC